MSRRAALIVANRAVGIAKLIEAEQFELVGYQLSCLTFKSDIRKISNQVQAIYDATANRDAVKIRLIASELLGLALQEKRNARIT